MFICWLHNPAACAEMLCAVVDQAVSITPAISSLKDFQALYSAIYHLASYLFSLI